MKYNDTCSMCGSYAINPGHHGRPYSDKSRLCDVCYFQTQADLARIALGDAPKWIPFLNLRPPQGTPEEPYEVLFWADGRVHIGHRSVDYTFAYRDGTPIDKRTITHWMYLPPPPDNKKIKGEWG